MKIYFRKFYTRKQKNKQLKGKKVLSGKIHYATTNYFLLPAIEGIPYHKGDNLENFENSMNENFWTGINYILVDSMLQLQIIDLIKQSKLETNTKFSYLNDALYQPTFEYEFSINGFKDIESLNFNLNGFNRLFYYYTSTIIKNGIAKSLVHQFWALLSITFQEVETERRLYKDLGYKTKYNPFL